MSEVITYALVAIVILVLGYAIVFGLAKAKRVGKAAAKSKAAGGAGPTPSLRSHKQAAEIANNLPDIKIKGAVKNGTKKKMGEIINEHPDEAMSLIRHWLHGNSDEDRD